MPGALKVWDGSAWITASASGSNTSVFVGPSAPAGTPRSGDLWYDSDEPSPFGSVIGVTNGGTGASNVAIARANLAVPQVGSGAVAGAPATGTWARGDTYIDSSNVVWVCATAGTPGTWAKHPTNMRWGVVSGTTDASGDLAITFSPAFPSAPTTLLATPNAGLNAIQIPLVHSVSATGGKVRFFNASAVLTNASGISFTYMAML